MESWSDHDDDDDDSDEDFSLGSNDVETSDDSIEDVVEFDDGNVNWRTSGAREILLDDLHRGVLTLDEELMPAEQAWEVYGPMDSFQLVPFKQFKRQLKAHRQQVLKLVTKSTPEYEAFRRDQATQEQFTHYASGRPIFAASSAHKLLKQDVSELFKEAINIGNLHQTRPEFASWTRAEFTRRVYQEVRYWKFVGYLEAKRTSLLNRETVKVGSKAKKRKGNP